MKDLPWYKIPSCPCCLSSYIETLSCGGHYNNLGIFDGDKDITVEYNLPIIDPNPEELVYPDWGQ